MSEFRAGQLESDWTSLVWLRADRGKRFQVQKTSRGFSLHLNQHEDFMGTAQHPFRKQLILTVISYQPLCSVETKPLS